MRASRSRGPPPEVAPAQAGPKRSSRSAAPAPAPKPAGKQPKAAAARKPEPARKPSPPSPMQRAKRKPAPVRFPGEADPPMHRGKAAAAQPAAPKAAQKQADVAPDREAPTEPARKKQKQATPAEPVGIDQSLPRPKKGDLLFFKGETWKVERSSYDAASLFAVSVEDSTQKERIELRMAQHLIAAQQQIAAASVPLPTSPPKPAAAKQPPPKPAAAKQPPPAKRLEREVVIVLCTATNKKGLVKDEAIPPGAQKFKRDFSGLVQASEADAGKSCTRMLLGELKAALDAPGYDLIPVKAGYSEGVKKNYALSHCDELVYRLKTQKKPSTLFVIVNAKVRKPDSPPNSASRR